MINVMIVLTEKPYLMHELMYVYAVEGEQAGHTQNVGINVDFS